MYTIEQMAEHCKTTPEIICNAIRLGKLGVGLYLVKGVYEIRIYKKHISRYIRGFKPVRSDLSYCTIASLVDECDIPRKTIYRDADKELLLCINVQVGPRELRFTTRKWFIEYMTRKRQQFLHTYTPDFDYTQKMQLYKKLQKLSEQYGTIIPIPE